MSYPDNATASIAQFLFRDSAGAMYIIPRRAFHNGAEYGDTVTLVQDLSGNGHDLTGTAVFDKRSFYGGNRPLDNVRDAPFIRDVNMSAPVSGMGTTIRAVPGETVMFDEGALDGAITGEFSVLILIDRTLSEREKHVVSELARLWGGANWTPGALFADGQDGVWLDPSDHSTLWIDEERTQNATQPGDVVWWIDDKSGNENHFSVDASANRSRLVRWPASAVREGYPRNLLTNTDQLSAWGASSSAGGSSASPVYNSEFDDWEFQTFVSSANISVTSPSPTIGIAGREVVARVQIRKYTETPIDTVMIQLRASSGSAEGPSTICYFNPVTGAIVQGAGVVMDMGTHWECQLAPSAPPGNYRIIIRMDNTPIGTKLGFRLPMLELGDTPTPYQRVGAGIWDVTEEGQPDCWGIEANGINNRYVSERGIPEYEDGGLRMLVGQTKLAENMVAGAVVSNGAHSTEASMFLLYAHLSADRSYYARYTPAVGGAAVVNTTPGAYPSPDTSVLDQQVDSAASTVTLQVGNDSSLTNGSNPGVIKDTNIWLMAFNAGNNPFNGIIWSTVLTAYEPDETLWGHVARDWLNNTNMPGVLSDDD